MWQNLLPGLRELRAPLSAGYIWLLGLWLAFRSLMSPGNHPKGIYRDIAELSAWGGKPATLAAVTFAAYVVGVMSMAVSHRAERIARPLVLASPMKRLHPRYWHERNLHDSLEEAALNKLSNRFLEDSQFRDSVISFFNDTNERAVREGGTWVRQALYEALPKADRLKREVMQNHSTRWLLLKLVINIDGYLESSEDDVGYLAQRLLGVEDKVYDEFDRLYQEGNFRLGIASPLVFLCCVLVARESWWWLFGLIFPVVLAYVGAESYIGSYRGLALAVAAGRVSLSALERLSSDPIDFILYEDLVNVIQR